MQGWFGGESDAVAATAGVRSDLAAVETAAEERRKLHDAFKRQWNEDDIIQVSRRAFLGRLTSTDTLLWHFVSMAETEPQLWRATEPAPAALQHQPGACQRTAPPSPHTTVAAAARNHDEFAHLQRGGSRPQWQLDQGCRKFQDLTDALERNAQAQKQVPHQHPVL